MVQEFQRKSRNNSEYSPRAKPEEWIPLLLDSYEIVSTIAKRFNVEVVVAGAGAYAFHVEADPTKDVDLVFTSPLPVEKLPYILHELSEKLKKRGWRIVGGNIQQGRSAEDWVIQVFVAVNTGRVVGVEVFNLLAMRPLTFYDIEEKSLDNKRLKTLTLESWIASKLLDPNGIDEHNIRRLEKAIEKGVNEAKLFQIIMRTGLQRLASINARDTLRRTNNPKLKQLLQMIV